jgi:hypothetical protein
MVLALRLRATSLLALITRSGFAESEALTVLSDAARAKRLEGLHSRLTVRGKTLTMKRKLFFVGFDFFFHVDSP